MKLNALPLIIIAIICCTGTSFIEGQNNSNSSLLIPPFNPKHYVCQRTSSTINIDGKLDDKDWINAAWSDEFVDIEGPLKPLPLYKTRIKMLWDENYLYVAAEMEEPHIWAKLTQRDAVIYYDNDFEVFIDPDGDTHFYYEYEVNAFNTVWDLLLGKPYRDGAPAINNWDINGLKSAVHIDGTLNDPSDIDEKWCVEIAFPLDVLHECSNGYKAEDGQIWRINFSRVQWQTTVASGKYQKSINPETNKAYPENNWVWSPQGVIAMHQPETWGFLLFSDKSSGEDESDFILPEYEKIKWELRKVYYAQKAFYNTNKEYSSDLKTLIDLGIPKSTYPIALYITPSLFEATIKDDSTAYTWHINQEGKTWKTKHN